MTGTCSARTAAWCSDPTSDVHADVLARDITVFGRHSGQLVATDVVDVRAEGTVSGQVISRRFILDPAANFTGRVEPQHLDAAVNVAKFHQKKRENARIDANCYWLFCYWLLH